jgi:N-acetylglucosamine kinase-like BadF-type ATPase
VIVTEDRVGRLVLGVDGGNSKTDALLLDTSGSVVASVRGPTVSHQAVGMAEGMARLGALVAELRSSAGVDRGGVPARAVLALAGADYPSDERRLRAAVAPLGLADSVDIVNDTWAGLRAGTDRGWGIVLICGSGTNAAGLAPDGRRWRFLAVGEIAGDGGGGGAIGMDGLRAAVRAWDGRGPATVLRTAIPEAAGLRRADALVRALYEGRTSLHVRSLAPVVFEAAMDGDVVARGIIDHQADELATMAGAIARRLRLTRSDPDVVLAGAVFDTDDAAFFERLESGVGRVIPRARLVRCSRSPAHGAALLALDALGAHRG